MARNKDQHWVPSGYLAAWVDPSCPPSYEGYVHIFDRDGGNARKKAPKNILSMPDLYTIFENGERNLRIEDAFSRAEQEFVRVRKKLHDGEDLDDDDLSVLYDFVGSMLARPPRYIEHYTKQYAAILERATAIRIDPSVPPPSLNAGPRMTLEEFSRLADDPMGTWFIDNVAANIEVLTARFGCDVLINDSEHPFLTSDSPATIYFPPRDQRYQAMPRGLGHPGCEITFPMSPRYALLFRHKKPGLHGFLGLDWEGVFETNFRTITRADQSIISNCEDICFVRTVVDFIGGRGETA